MSKKSSYIWSRNILQTNYNNKSTTNKAICYQTFSIEKQSKQNQEINCHRKLFKTANINKRYATSKDKFRTHNCLPNNRARGTTRRNITRTLHFNTNVLGLKGVAVTPKSTECKSSRYSKNNFNGKLHHCNHFCNQNHNLHMNCKCSTKLLNLPQPQQHLRIIQQDFEKSNKHKSFNKTHKIHTPNALCHNHQHECLPYVIPLKMDKNLHCHHSHLHGGAIISNKLQLHDVKSSVSRSTQLSRYHHHHRHHDSQLTCLPQVSQHQEHLLGMFEVLPPLFLLKTTPGKVTENHEKYLSHLESIQYKSSHSCADVLVGGNPKMLQPLPLRHEKHFKLDYDKILKC
ncbi:uncharacterized protein LOC119611066 isoform X2 [Lucilia sericata]|nr:uncharacterized protein LOC119611066 isoform X2 [Lucilia sericata]